MSKYPVRWLSESKGVALDIESLPHGYLQNCLAKTERLLADNHFIDESAKSHMVAVRDCLAFEIGERERLAREQAHEEAPPPEDEDGPPVEDADWRGQ